MLGQALIPRYLLLLLATGAFFAGALPAHSHPMNTSNSRLTVGPKGIRAVFNFLLVDLAGACGLDADGNDVLTTAELRDSIGLLYACLDPHIDLSLDSRPAGLKHAQKAFRDKEIMRMLPGGYLRLKPGNPAGDQRSASPGLDRLPGEVQLAVRFENALKKELAHTIVSLAYRIYYDAPPGKLHLTLRLHRVLGEDHAHIAYVDGGLRIQPAVFSAKQERHAFSLGE